MNYYTVPCKDWAIRFAAGRPGAKILRITVPNDLCMGWITLPNGGKRIDPPWFEHYVVYYGGQIYDQAYFNGISPQEYKEKWEFADVMLFPPGCGI